MSSSAAFSSPKSAKAKPQSPRSVAITSADAERRRMEAVGDGASAFGAGLPFAGRHRLVGDEQVVQPARTGQADLVGRVEDAGRRSAAASRALSSVSACRKRLRRQAGPAAEQMMQLGRRHARGFGDLLDLRLVAPVAADMRDGAAHDVVVGRRPRWTISGR